MASDGRCWAKRHSRNFDKQPDLRGTVMPTYQFSGIDQQGRRRTGDFGAADESELESRLLDRGVWLLDAKEVEATPVKNWRWHGASRRALRQFCTLMAFQTRVGIPLATALETAAQDGDSR